MSNTLFYFPNITYEKIKVLKHLSRIINSV